jgi:SAM-dependent methyltransferase
MPPLRVRPKTRFRTPEAVPPAKTGPNGTTCPCCGGTRHRIFHEVERVPTHCCLLIADRDEALAAPVGRLRLAFCEDCGFIYNQAFDPNLIDYSEGYEDDQSFSASFRSFAAGIADRVIDTYDIRDRNVLEIGCGAGYFLELMCERGNNHGVGIDPSAGPERTADRKSPRVRFERAPYGSEHYPLPADLIACRHTLEHLPDPRSLVESIHRHGANGTRPVVFFEIPDVARVLDDLAFWDLYYEHCSYFTLGSLARLFRACGFDLLRLEKEYDGQYLMLDARAGGDPDKRRFEVEDDLDCIDRAVTAFAADFPARIEHWRNRITSLHAEGRRTVLWGAGSKAVGFLTTLGRGIDELIETVVDINPNKAGMYLAGTGQRIAAPEQLRESPPDLVIAMNPIYADEIREQIRSLGVAAEVETV